jgi:hypothetical protein
VCMSGMVRWVMLREGVPLKVLITRKSPPGLCNPAKHAPEMPASEGTFQPIHRPLEIRRFGRRVTPFAADFK